MAHHARLTWMLHPFFHEMEDTTIMLHSPAGAELYAVLKSSAQRTLKDSSSAVEKWLRDNVARLETMITHHILTLEK